jgi:hypothetical protein
MTLWHYTCEHGRRALGETGTLLPAALQSGVDVTRIRARHRWLLQVAWATDLDAPDIAGLGLTNETISCERWRHRYRITNESAFAPWHSYARTLPVSERDLLETATGALPAHWWVATLPAVAVYSPVLVTA